MRREQPRQRENQIREPGLRDLGIRQEMRRRGQDVRAELQIQQSSLQTPSLEDASQTEVLRAEGALRCQAREEDVGGGLDAGLGLREDVWWGEEGEGRGEAEEGGDEEGV